MGWKRSLGKAWRKTKRITRKVVKSKALRYTAYGVAVVYPPVGVPAVAAVESANQYVKAYDDAERSVKKAKRAVTKAKGKGPSAREAAMRAVVDAERRRAAARAVIANTKKAADAGDKGAKRAAAAMRLVSQAKRGDAKAKAALRKVGRLHDAAALLATRVKVLPTGRLEWQT